MSFPCVSYGEVESHSNGISFAASGCQTVKRLKFEEDTRHNGREKAK
jgi:hypothetical protein